MTSRKQAQRQALLVVGMHRSGTSALTRAINLHGVSLGSKLLVAAADNEVGFWENQHVVDLHDRLLASMGSSWDDPRELPDAWVDHAMSSGYHQQLADLIASEFGDARIWAVKDPRLCRLLPLWLKVLEHLDIEPKLIFALRHPLEVAGSLKRRDELSIALGCVLWLRHLAEPVHASRTLRRCAVGYDELLSDWRSCMTRIASTLDVDWPVPSEVCGAEVDAHVRHDLRHQRASATPDALPAPWRDLLTQLYSVGQSVAMATKSWSSFEADLDAAMTRFTFTQPLLAELPTRSSRTQARLTQAQEVDRVSAELNRIIEQRSRDLERVQQELGSTRHELNSMRAELEVMRASLSWRWTRPIRVVRAIWSRSSGRGATDARQQRID
jgi:hypothetical protein